MKLRIPLIAGVGICALVLSGCNVGADHATGNGDAGVQQPRVKEIKPNQGMVGQQNDPASIINFSDKYPNVEFKCNGLDGIYVITRAYTVPVIVPNDPQCK